MALNNFNMKRALIFGINYRGSNSELNGCINDAQNMLYMLVNHYDYNRDCITLMTDDTDIKPTKYEMLKSLNEFISSSKDCNEMFLHYSGHGTNIKDKNNDEEDGLDECLVPLDYMYSGIIKDDELKSIVQLINPNTKLWIVIDACHSATMFDLEYKLECLSVQHSLTNPLRFNDYVFSDWSYEYKISKDIKYKNDHTNKINIVTISGCKDNQTSADAFINNEYQGALTKFLLESLKLNKYSHNLKLVYLLKDLHCMLKQSKFSQKPVIQSSKIINIDDLFM